MTVLVGALIVGAVVSLFASSLADLIGGSRTAGTDAGPNRQVAKASPQRHEGGDWLYGLGLFVAMLLGIVANYFWTHGFAGRVNWDQLARPILVSPIVFMAVYVAATKQPRGALPVLLAFQNGFFWQTVLQGNHI
jgi:hypothetical protein